MKKKLNLRDFAILQLVVLIYTSSTVISRGAGVDQHDKLQIYTSSTVISKIAAQSAESGKGWTFLLLYGAEIGVLGIYALCWQQVIKRVELSVAYANRAMALLWSLLWAVLLFGEQITVKKLIGVGLVLAGTLIINGGKEQENHD